MNISQIEAYVRVTLGHSDDLSVVRVRVGKRMGVLCFLRTMTSATFVADTIIRPLSDMSQTELDEGAPLQLEWLMERHFGGLQCVVFHDEQELGRKLVSGYAALAFEGLEGILAMDVTHLATRSIDEPTSQTVVRGPKEGFTESAQTNMSLIRRRLLNERLRFEKHCIGEESRTDVYLGYIEGGIDPRIVRKLRADVRKVKVRSLLDSGSLEEMLRPRGLQLFPTMLSSERPDTVCASLLEGRVSMIVNGSPFVLIVPAVLNDFLKSPEDTYQWFAFGTFTRMLRYLALLISLFLSSLYVAITNFQQELVPTVLLTSIAAQREDVPFPAAIEVLLMEIVFEILREAGTRMPRILGQAISIVGALVLGQAAVEAGIVSNFLVIVVAMAAIAGFVAPVYSFGANIRLLRFGNIIVASIFGLYGVILAAAFLLVHMVRLQSYGVPYLSPFSPFNMEGQKDAMLRFQTPTNRRAR